MVKGRRLPGGAPIPEPEYTPTNQPATGGRGLHPCRAVSVPGPLLGTGASHIRICGEYDIRVPSAGLPVLLGGVVCPLPRCCCFQTLLELPSQSRTAGFRAAVARKHRGRSRSELHLEHLLDWPGGLSRSPRTAIQIFWERE